MFIEPKINIIDKETGLPVQTDSISVSIFIVSRSNGLLGHRLWLLCHTYTFRPDSAQHDRQQEQAMPKSEHNHQVEYPVKSDEHVGRRKGQHRDGEKC